MTINLAPADLRKVGPVYDLPIAVGLMAVSDQVPLDRLENTLFIGELSLDGTLRHIDGVLPMAHMAQELGIQTVYLPEADAPEAALIRGLEVIPVPSLSTLVSHLRDFDPIPAYEHAETFDEDQEAVYAVDWSDVKGQEHVKRALEVAAAGAHNCFKFCSTTRCKVQPAPPSVGRRRGGLAASRRREAASAGVILARMAPALLVVLGPGRLPYVADIRLPRPPWRPGWRCSQATTWYNTLARVALRMRHRYSW